MTVCFAVKRDVVVCGRSSRSRSSASSDDSGLDRTPVNWLMFPAGLAWVVRISYCCIPSVGVVQVIDSATSITTVSVVASLSGIARPSVRRLYVALTNISPARHRAIFHQQIWPVSDHHWPLFNRMVIVVWAPRLQTDQKSGTSSQSRLGIYRKHEPFCHHAASRREDYIPSRNLTRLIWSSSCDLQPRNVCKASS